MLYQRSFAIERRLDETLELIQTGKHSTPSLAKALRVSIPTVSRCITALRERGHDVRSMRAAGGWHYILIESVPPSFAGVRPGKPRMAGASA
jgi:biotin operon repressor